jgi:hypothetical protein
MNQTGYFLIAGVLISLFPAFYYGYKKNIFVIVSEKYNIFPIQLIFYYSCFSCVLLYFINGILRTFDLYHSVVY